MIHFGLEGGLTDKDSSHFGGSFITEIWVVINHKLNVGEWDGDHNRNQQTILRERLVSGETWSQKQDHSCYLRGMKDLSGVRQDKIR